MAATFPLSEDETARAIEDDIVASIAEVRQRVAAIRCDSLFSLFLLQLSLNFDSHRGPHRFPTWPCLPCVGRAAVDHPKKQASDRHNFTWKLWRVCASVRLSLSRVSFWAGLIEKSRPQPFPSRQRDTPLPAAHGTTMPVPGSGAATTAARELCMTLRLARRHTRAFTAYWRT